MKTFPAGLDTLLATGVYVHADLYDFTLSDGSTHLRYTTADTDVRYGGNTYTSKGPFFENISSPSRGHWRRGLDVDTWQVTVAPVLTDPVTGAAGPTILSQPWLSAVRAGALNGATVDIHRGYMAAWPSPWASPLVFIYVLVDIFAGRVAAIDMTRVSAIISINSHVEQLLRSMPRNVFQAGCRHTLFGSGCALASTDFDTPQAVVTVTNNGQFTTGLTGTPTTDYFSLGRIVWTSGNNVGWQRSIRQYTPTGGELQLIAPMPYDVQAGDTFTAFPGCAKSLSVCTTVFSNSSNFGGMPGIPAPETAI